MYKAAVLETENDLLQFDPHRYLLFGMFAPVAARPQFSHVRRHLEHVKSDLEYFKKIMSKSPTDHKS